MDQRELDRELHRRRARLLDWREDHGVGPPADPWIYDVHYWQHYCELAKTEMGCKLLDFRLALVWRIIPEADEVVDVGCGSGDFVMTRGGNTWGYDICPAALGFMMSKQRFRDPYKGEKPMHVCCWDSLEHMDAPGWLIDRTQRYFFVTLPIFKDRKHVLSSKHFKPGEHVWYWTEKGLVKLFGRHGFCLVEKRDDETRLGREDILTFVFCRWRA